MFGDVVVNGRGIYKDPQTLEECATFLELQMEVFSSFETQLSDGLKPKRKSGGLPFSTDRKMLDIELYVSLWLQRQRLMFELLYHDLALNLYRPFLCFPSTFAAEVPPETSSAFTNLTPVTDNHANSCIEHAMAIIRMMHQILIGSEILIGMHEAFHFQWNATVSLIGFILAYPLSPLTPEVRENINNAIAVFETFGKHFAVGASAANVTRNLVAKADYPKE